MPRQEVPAGTDLRALGPTRVGRDHGHGRRLLDRLGHRGPSDARYVEYCCYCYCYCYHYYHYYSTDSD